MRHPELEDLRALAVGDDGLDPRRVERVLDHLEICDECSGQLDVMLFLRAHGAEISEALAVRDHLRDMEIARERRAQTPRWASIVYTLVAMGAGGLIAWLLWG